MQDPKDKDSENKEPAFKVQDRRRFSSEGETKADSEESTERVEMPPPSGAANRQNPSKLRGRAHRNPRARVRGPNRIAAAVLRRRS